MAKAAAMAFLATALLSLVLLSAPTSARAEDPMINCTWWSHDYCSPQEDGSVTLGCNMDNMGAMRSNYVYYHGIFSAWIKLPAGYSGSTCTAFYLINDGSDTNKDPTHFEIDIEFFGSNNPRNINLATNVFFAGRQNLAQFKLPFDPSEDYHKYTILWNQWEIRFYVDGFPIRIIHRSKDEPWPELAIRPIVSQWEINFGTYPPNFSKGPVQSHVKWIEFNGCRYPTPDSSKWDPAWAKCPTWTDGGQGSPWNDAIPGALWAGLQDNSYGFSNNATVVNQWGWDKA